MKDLMFVKRQPVNDQTRSVGDRKGFLHRARDKLLPLTKDGNKRPSNREKKNSEYFCYL
jgi:hypothetical protein